MKRKLILLYQNTTKSKISRKWLEEFLNQLLLKYKISGMVEIGVSIVGERKIRNLNKKFRKIDKVTDVLSFPQKITPNLPYNLLGDIVICWSQLLKQSIRAGHSPKKELQLLLEHSLKHLIGIHHH